MKYIYIKKLKKQDFIEINYNNGDWAESPNSLK